MRRQEVTFRITKINKRAVAIAVCALTGATMPMLSSAQNVYLGSSFPSGSGITPTRTGDTFYTNTITSAACNGSAVAPGAFAGSPAIYTCPAGGNVNNTYILNDSETRLNQFGQVLSANNHYFGQGVQVDSLTLGTAGSVSGNGGVGNPYVLQLGSASAYAVNDTAIDLGAATAYFYGGNLVNGSTTAATINILGSNVEFNGIVSGNVNLSSDGVVFRDTVTGNIDILTGAGGTFDRSANLTGNLSFSSNNGTFTFAGGNTVTGNITATGVNSAVTFSGDATVTGGVGATGIPNAPVGTVSVNGAGSLVRLNTLSGDTVINTLSINAPQAVVQVNGKLIGNVSLDGHSSKLQLQNRGVVAANAGMTGTLNFGTFGLGANNTQGAGTLEVGDNVNLTFGTTPATALSVSNANNATLIFSGTSTISGTVGAARTSTDTFNRIWAGANGESVTFSNNVYVFQRGAGSGTLTDDTYTGQLRTGSGTVNLQGDLFGDLVIGTNTIAPRPLDAANYTGYGNQVAGSFGDGGTVNVSDGKTISGSVTTNATGTGTLNFLGSSNYAGGAGTTAGQIGATTAKLAAVTFNSAAATATNTISNHVYANLTTIGNGASATVATLTRSGVVGDTTLMYLGDRLTIANTTTTLNFDASFGTAGTAPALLNITKDQTTGQLSNAATVRSVVGGAGTLGVLSTNGGTLNFSVDSGAPAAANGNIVTASSSRIDVLNAANAVSGTITVNNTEKYNIVFLGSLANNQTYKLVAGDTTGTLVTAVSEGARLRDNSFVIDTTIRNGSIELLATRANDQYITKSDPLGVGHFSNPAALQLGTLAATGANYSSDMQVVFNKLDIDQWGYGNTEANLATQVKRLAPIVNGSDLHSAFAATNSALRSVSERLAVLRGDSPMVGTDGNGRQFGGDNTGWAKLLGGVGRGESIGAYDAYKTRLSGVAFGFDTKLSSGVVGLMAHVSNTSIKQQDFRSGDRADMMSAGLGLYATQEYGPAYVEGNLHYAAHKLDSNRATVIDRVANSDVDYRQTTARLAAGYRLAIEGTTHSLLTPFVGFEVSRLKQEAYTETNAGAVGLEVDSRNIRRNKTTAGLKFNTLMQLDGGSVLYPELLVAANQYSGLGQAKTSVQANYIGDLDKTDFVTTGVTPSKSSYTVGASVRYAVSKNSEMRFGYNFEGSKNLNLHEINAKATWMF